MKTRSLGILLASVLICGSLTACKPIDKDSPNNFIDANLNEVDKGKDITFDDISYLHSYEGLINYRIYDARYIEQGILFLTNENLHVGIYSLNHNSFILNCCFFAPYLTYEVKMNEIGTFIKLDYELHSIIIDNLGNELLAGDPIYNWSVTPHFVNNDTYIEVCASNQKTLNYKYIKGTPTLVDVIPLPNVEDDSKDETSPIVPEYIQGDYLKEGNIVDLDLFGKSGYYLNATDRGLTTTFDDENNPIVSYVIPTSDNVIITSDYIYYQEISSISKNIPHYSYIIDEEKYDLKTWKVDIFNGKKSEINFPHVINEVKIYKDFIGKFTNIVASLSSIDENFGLKTPNTYLINKDLKVLSNYTEILPQSFIKLDNGNYYNFDTHILYNANLKEIINFDDMEPEFYPRLQLFKCKIYDKQGLYDTNGEVYLQCKYDNIIINDQRPYAILQRNYSSSKTFDLYNIAQKANKLSYEGKLRVYDAFNGLYGVENVYGDYVNLISLSGKSKQIYVGNSSEYIGYTVNNKLNDYKTLILKYKCFSSKYSPYKFYVFRYGKDEFASHTLRDEIYEDVITGSSFEDAIPLDLGSKFIHPNPFGQKTYMKLENPQTGLYSLKGEEDGYYANEVYVKTFKGEIVKLTNAIIDDKILLSNNFTYYFVGNVKRYQLMTVTCHDLSKELTEEPEVILKGQTTIREYTPKQGGHYRLKSKNITIKIMTFDYSGYEDLNLDVHEVDNSEIFYLNGGLRYFFCISNTSDLSGEYVFDEYHIDDILTASDGYTFFVTAHSKSVRKFRVNNSGKYVVDCNIPTYTINRVNGNSLNSVRHDNYNGINVMYLNSGIDYVLIVDNDTIESKNAIFTLKTLSYETIPTFEVGGEALTIKSNYVNLFKFSVPSDGKYTFTTPNSCYSPRIYRYDGGTSSSLLNSQIMNDVEVYDLRADTKYIIYIDGVSSYTPTYQMQCLRYDLDNLPVLSDSAKYFNSSSYTKFMPIKNGFYQITVTNSDIALNVYELDNKNQTYNSVTKIPYPNLTNYYYLEAGKTYIVAATNCTYSYNIYINYKTSSLNIGGAAYTIDKYQWQDIGPGRYESTNHTNNSSSKMKINILSSGTISFKYDVSSENYYDRLIVYHNGYTTSLSPDSGNLTNYLYSRNVQAGDILEIVYRKDNSGSHGNDCARIYKIEHSATTSIRSHTFNLLHIDSKYLLDNDIYIQLRSGDGKPRLIKCNSVDANICLAEVPYGATHYRVFIYAKGALPDTTNFIAYSDEFKLDWQNFNLDLKNQIKLYQ